VTRAPERRARDVIRSALVDAVVKGLNIYGPHIVGGFLFGLVSLILALAAIVVLGSPAWVAGVSAAAPAGAAAWMRVKGAVTSADGGSAGAMVEIRHGGHAAVQMTSGTAGGSEVPGLTAPGATIIGMDSR
jgi:hypothetical protein